MLRLLPALVVLSALVSAALPTPARAYCRLTTEDPEPMIGCAAPGTWLEWRRQCLSFSVVARSASEPDFERIRDEASFAFGAWAAAECDGRPLPLEISQTTELSSCEEPEYNLYSPNSNSIIFVEDWSGQDLPLEAIGLTSIHYNFKDGEILDSDIQINDSGLPLAICTPGDCQRGMIDVRNVIVHEAGHFLGLGHSNDSEATMSFEASSGETKKRDLHADDVEGICAMYGALPEPDCRDADFQPDNGFGAPCVGPEEPPTRTVCSCAVPGGGARPRSGAWLLPLFACVLGARLRRRRC
ncbi:MAG: M10 family metallopeptidase domain-containing protein [Myxococcales bacterium]|nr:M10 family metallopeptidase domain-containing protein [Myxococcales bacterium]